MKKPYGCVEYAVVAVAMAVFFVFLMPTICPPHCGSRASITRCANNLVQMNKLVQIYRSRTGGTAPSPSGADFWLSLSTMNPPLIEERHRGIYLCPVLGSELGPDSCDYRGPAVPYAALSEDDPIGADREANHDGDAVNVLLKDGSVHLVFPDDGFWSSCRSLLSP